MSATIAGFEATAIGPNDDGSLGPVVLPFAINYFGTRYDQLWINNNGNLTFNEPLSTYTPFGLTGNIGTPIIAPFFADVDTRGGGVVSYGTGTVDGHAAFGVTYRNVGYFNQNADKTNTFQVLIIDRSDIGAGPNGVDFDIEFNYDRIQWEAGDASGASGGLGGKSAAAGFSNGTGQPDTYFQIEGSAVGGGLLDSNPVSGLVHRSYNNATPGRYVFYARNGDVALPPADNHDRAHALDLGVAPGIHITDRGSAAALGDDWYKFELHRPDSLDVTIAFDGGSGTLTGVLQREDGSPAPLGSVENFPGSTRLHYGVETMLPAGIYYLRVATQTGLTNVYDLDVDPGVGSTTRVWYVNDGHIAGDLSATAPGDDAANSGAAPASPKATLASLLASIPDLGGRDLIHVDTGFYGGAAPVIGASAGGVIFAGSPVGTNVTSGIELAGASNNTITLFNFLGYGYGVWVHAAGSTASNNNLLTKNYFGQNSTTAIVLAEGTGNRVTKNFIASKGSYGVSATAAGDLTIQGNTISGPATAIYVGPGSSVNVSVVVDANQLSGGTTGIDLQSTSIRAQLSNNSLRSYSSYGINAGSTADVFGNTVSASGVGIYSASTTSDVYGNVLHDNAVGVKGFGRLGGVDWETSYSWSTHVTYNDVYGNGIGVVVADGAPGDLYGYDVPVQFNRIHDNGVGIDARRPANIHHNVVFGNTTGVVIVGAARESLTNNTIHSLTGTGVQISGAARNVALKNNILTTDAGTDLFVATDSQQGFASDYNNYYKTTAGATLVWWQKPFADVFDWQAEAAFDLHSLGYTVPNPARDNPNFVNLAGNDFRLTSAGSTSIDAGDPTSGFAEEQGNNGNRVNLGAYGNTRQAEASAAAFLALDFPNFYADWWFNCNFTILWHAYGVSGNVKLELYDATTGVKAADIAASVPAAAGSYTWLGPASSVNPTNDAAKRFLVRISSYDQPAVTDASREPFAIVAPVHDYYVSPAGSNRNTGTTPLDPKASLLPLLSAYRQQLGPSDVVHVAAGDYNVVRNILVSADASGHSQGFKIIGDATSPPRFDRANPFPGSTNIEISNASFVTLENFILVGAERGLWLHNRSTYFRGDNITVAGNSADGIYVEQDSTGVSFGVLQAHDNAGNGIAIAAPIARVSDSAAFNNGQAGILLTNAGGAIVDANDVYNNNVGISVYNLGNPPTLVGTLNLADGRGNRVHGNRSVGIDATQYATIAGNAVYGQSGIGAVGIRTDYSTTISQNLVYENTYGVVAGAYYGGGNIVEKNRIYANSQLGVLARGNSEIRANVIYSNGGGLLGQGAASGAPFSGVIANNLIYLNGQGVRIESANGPAVLNNTVYQRVGDAVTIAQASQNVLLRNNILGVDSGYDLVVAPDSQSGFASDYNDLWTTGTGKVAFWQGIDRPDLLSWRYTAFTDFNSLAVNPQFVTAPASLTGYVSTVVDGRTDDLHEQSVKGSFHGGSLAPVRDAATGKPLMLPLSAPVADAVQAGTIDLGDTASSYANEASPNGRYVNIGAYGNTPQASLSRDEFVIVTRPGLGDVWPAGQPFPIRWRSQDSLGNVVIELWRQGGSAPAEIVAAAAPNSGEYLWSIPANLPPAGDYFVRVIQNAVVGNSNHFATTAPIHAYYVNDGVVEVGDWTSSPGNDALAGTDAAHPKSSIRAILESYTLGSGDVVYVDAGAYNLDVSLIVTAADAGVRIEGYHDAGYVDRRATLVRGNTGSNVVSVQGATGVTLDHLSITGGAYGVSLVGSPGAVISHSRIYSNSYGIVGDGGSVDVEIFGSEVFGVLNLYGSPDQYQGIQLSGSGADVHDNRVYDSYYGIGVSGAGSQVRDNDVFGNLSWGVSANVYPSGNVPTLVSGNMVHGNGTYGISVYGNALVTDNTVYSQNVGIWLDGSYEPALAENNTVYGNGYGIAITSNGVARANRAYANSVGISDSGGGVIERNQVYSNVKGVVGANNYYSPFVGQILNNLVYANQDAGLEINGGSASALIRNNTVYQPVGDAVRIQGGSSGVQLRNNILQVDSGYALSIAADSQNGFTSDYNDLWTTGSGKLAFWQGQTAPFSRSFTTLTDWVYELGLDQHSQAKDPLFVSPTGTDGLLGFVSDVDHGGDDDFRVQSGSPTIDAGDLNDPFLAEPGPNGGRINLGHAGDTSQATNSPPQLVQILAPNGREKFQVGTTTTVRWRTAGLTGVLIDLHYSADNGATWTPLASGLATDADGLGTFAWSIPAGQQQGDQYLVRASAQSSAAPHDSSDASFLVTNAGHDYYVAPTGDNANSGKEPTAPMSSLVALINLYRPGAGDTLHVAGGEYKLLRNITLDSRDSGLVVAGPTSGTPAIINRGHTSGIGFELIGSANVTLDRLSVFGGFAGVKLTGSPGTMISHSFVSANTYGVDGDGASAGVQIVGSLLADNYFAIQLSGADAVVRENIVSGSYYGIAASAPRALVANNDVHDNGYVGISVLNSSAAPGDQSLVRDNTVHDNGTYGISVSGYVLATKNTAHSQNVGIQVDGYYGTAAAEDNTVYGNVTGISMSYNGVARDNRVYGNGVGVYALGGGLIERNSVYSNNKGIVGAGTFNYPFPYFTGQVLNNLVYANQEVGVEIYAGFNGATVVNNTVYQLVGDAVRISANSSSVKLRNNILWIEVGFALNVGAGTNALDSDYNLFYVGPDQSCLCGDDLPSPDGHYGLWQGATIDSLAAWQTTAGVDAHSRFGWPGFQHVEGADGFIGYNAFVGYDSGRDDNFQLSAGSPAIDGGDSAGGTPTDKDGFGRQGLADIGAYEFRGSNSDLTAPIVVATTPAVIAASGTSQQMFSQFDVLFSEPLAVIDAAAPASYRLQGRGADDAFDTNDDVVYELAPTYLGGQVVTLEIVTGDLPVGTYRLAVLGEIHDLAGNRLAGDGTDGGTDYVREFSLTASAPALSLTNVQLSDEANSSAWQGGAIEQFFAAVGGAEESAQDAGTGDDVAESAIPSPELLVAAASAYQAANESVVFTADAVFADPQNFRLRRRLLSVA